MALRKAGSVLVVFFWSVAVVLGQDGWSVTYTPQSICALKGSTVHLTCSYTYPSGTVTSIFWFTKMETGVKPEDLCQDPEYAGRLEYHGDKEKDCTLRIKDLRERDSSTYLFRLLTDQEGGTYTGSPGVKLSVTDLQVKVTGGHQDKTLTCITTCTLTDNPTFIWYKNGQRLDEPTSQQYSVNSYYSDSYSCAVEGHEDHHSPAVCVRGESCFNVTYTHQSICALKGSTVDISCFYTHPSWHNVTEVSWFSKWESGVTKDLSQDSEYTSRVEYHRQTEKDSTLRITDLRVSDSTEYKFRFTTNEARWGYSFPGTTLTVTGLQVKVTGGHQNKTLTCITTCTLTDNPTYIWYKNGQHLDESTSPQYKDPVYSNYVDSYSCAVKGHEDLHSPAVCVQGQICKRVTYTKRRICVLKGSTVDISCTYVGYVTSSLWFSPKRSASWINKLTPEDLTRNPGYAGRVEYAGRESGTYKGPFTLRITDLREEDSAEYRFTFKTYNFEWGHSFPGTTLSVTGLQVKVTPAAEGQKTLTCITTCTLTDNPTFIWYKNGQRLDEPTSQQYSVNSYYSDSYSCAVEGHEDHHSPAVCVRGESCMNVTYTHQSICALKGSTVDISCFYTHPSWHNVTEVSWFNKWESGVTKDLSQDSEYTSRVEYHRQTEKDSTMRITDLRVSDSTEYKFRFTTNEARWGYSFPGTTLTVTGLQVKVTGGHQNKTLTCITTCTLTDNPTYIWYKNGQHLDESTSPQYKDPVSSNYEDSYSCAVKGHEDLHSPAVCVQGQSCKRVTYTKRRICVLKGSTVDISCTYVGYVTSSLWFSPKRNASWTNKLTPEDLTRDPGYAGRVEYAGRESGTYKSPFTLRITDLGEEDSAEYRFTFKTYNFEWGHSFPGTTLSVTGLQVKVTPAAEGQKTLTCSTTCTLTDNPTYIWYKNGQHLDEPTSQQYSVNSYYSDSYSCAVEGHEDHHSPAVCIRGESCFNVTYTHQSICALKGSTVDISCFYTHPSWHNVTEVSWFNKWESGVTKDLSQDSEYTSRVEYHQQTEKYSTLRITDLRDSDSTEYKFRFTTNEARWGYSFPGTTLTVTGFQVKVTGGNQDKTLTCITTCTLTDNPTYIWYKNGQHLDESTSPQYKDPVYSNYEDSYSCAVKGHEDLHSPAVCVQGQSCKRVTYTKRRICVLKGSTVDISCTYVGYDTVTSSLWFSPKQSASWTNKLTPEDLTRNPGYAGRVEYAGRESGTYKGPFTLRITDLREEDSAEYRFTFKTYNFEWGHSFPGTTLSVTGLEVKVTPAAEGQKTLTCSTTCTLTDNPTFIWYKNGQRLDEPTSQQYSVNSYYSDSYSCAVEGHEDHHSPAVCVRGENCLNVTYTHQSICALKGSTVDISCFYTHPSWHNITEVSWFNKWESGVTKDLRQVSEYTSRVEYHRQREKDSTLRITDLRESDSTEYKFRFTTNEARWGYNFPGTTLTVTGFQVKVTGGHQDKTLTCITTCTLTDNPTYIWFKNGQLLDESTSPQYKYSASSNHENSYSCGVKGHEELHSPAVYAPKNTSVSVSPSGEIVEGSSVTLTCSSDANPPVDKYTWYKKNVASPKASGQSYSITNIISEDRGDYYCEAENTIASMNSTALMIIVAGDPQVEVMPQQTHRVSVLTVTVTRPLTTTLWQVSILTLTVTPTVTCTHL
ncbi:uncharacterized protein isoform X2 [Salmo salar]|uniref:B-cell receptor CD22 n=1 Tax=Salmo salar TaxID=8030 RepID=A0ABM3EE73_SALSA|nr:uncharacterized protein LOC106590934 isoform X2 [Salmo salar]